MVQASGPVDDDVRLFVVEPNGPADGARRVQLAEFEQSIEHGAVFAYVEALQLSVVVLANPRVKNAQQNGGCRL